MVWQMSPLSRSPLDSGITTNVYDPSTDWLTDWLSYKTPTWAWKTALRISEYRSSEVSLSNCGQPWKMQGNFRGIERVLNRTGRQIWEKRILWRVRNNRKRSTESDWSGENCDKNPRVQNRKCKQARSPSPGASISHTNPWSQPFHISLYF
jgi:hypothetical protein